MLHRAWRVQDTSVPSPSARRPTLWLWALSLVWAIAVVSGLRVLWAYDNTPGEAGQSPAQWPAETRLARAADRPTLVLLAHPQCSCTRATLGELAEVLARAKARPKTYVVFLKPSSLPRDWEKSDLWRTAERLPDATVIRDDDGLEAARFAATTSGQTVLYDRDGVLRFSGGITGARGHSGDNAGRRSLLELLNQPHRAVARRSSGGNASSFWTSVFGCRLFTRAS
jgi:hypothetical protein